MVIIFSKTLEKKKGGDHVRAKDTEYLLLRERHTMSRGTTLFSCGTVEADRWLDLGRGCAIQRGTPCESGASLESLWDVLPEECQRRSLVWGHEVGPATAITSLIRDLNLGDAKLAATQSLALANPPSASTAPPSKRQCRSLSFSEEFGGCRSSWRPQVSRVWTAVEKRRCHSGGSVHRCSGGGGIGGGGGYSGGHFPAMQRSSSFSLPSRSNNPTDGALELPCFTQRLPLHPLFTASPMSPTSPSHHHYHHSLRPLSLSHEQISLPEHHREGASSPDFTQEMGRRAGQRAGGTGGLSRSKSQPCVLNDKKIGMKRRRPEDAQEPRPSLDLAKMTQKLQTFHSLSCPGFSGPDSCRSYMPPPSTRSLSQSESDFACASDLCAETQQEVDEEEDDSSYKELDSDSACSLDSRPGSPCRGGGERMGQGHTPWKGEYGTEKDIYQLGGELDIDQIERN
uniref:protein FAM53B-like n=1 Tax=Oncorhynchus gorbuscha TaxID=8017 RepID=UPI001EAEB9AD|nr:protein FAM53B-like [Oncorhynchus gorbuscha]XP_046214528.1 protein FAM53B-like [Oncorhynchus gorbuscha]